MRTMRQRFGGRNSWRHSLWLPGLGLLAVAWWIVHSPLPTSPPVPVAIDVQLPKPAIDATFLAIMETARQDAVELGQRRLTNLVTVLARRVETVFLPHYLSFGRRKLEELHAYNDFAWNQFKGLVGGESLDTATPLLLKTFEDDFSALIITPDETNQSLRTIGREIARRYAMLVANGLQKLQENRGIQFAQWQTYLDSVTHGQVLMADGSILNIPITALTVPDPIRDRLGDVIGNALVERLSKFPKVTADVDGLRMPDGRSIFDIGSDAWTYYGSYVLYWVTLVTLLRSGIIPANLFAFLLGWLAWESFVWGSWIAFESFNFEQTKAQLEPIILHQTDIHFASLRVTLTDPSINGPFQILWGVEQAWQGAASSVLPVHN